MSSTQYATELSGLFTILQDAVIRLQANPTDSELTNKVKNLQTQLTNLHDKFKNTNISSSAALEKQKKTSEIIAIEKKRLELKKQAIDNALTGKQRAIALNESYRLRQNDVTKIKIAFVLTLAASIFLVLLGRYYTSIPSVLITLFILITLSIGIIYTINIYLAMSARSKLNYNELDLGGPKVLTKEEEEAARAAEGKKGNLLGTLIPGCVGQDCCGETTVWDPTTFKCIMPTTFTTMSNNTLVYSPNEYDKYSKI
jgi:hypothetical protein